MEGGPKLRKGPGSGGPAPLDAPLSPPSETIGAPLSPGTVSTIRWIVLVAALAAALAALAISIVVLIQYGNNGGGGGSDPSVEFESAARIGRESLNNPIESRVVQVIVAGDGVSICSGFFVDAIGTFVTAVHCFQEPGICDFDPTVPEYPLVDAFYTVEVMGVNGTNEKWTMYAEVLGWTGLADVMVMRVLPFTKADGSIITIVSQPYFQFGHSWELQKGQPLNALSFDFGFLAKLGHRGAVQAIQKNMGSSVEVTIDQVFFDGNVEPGASGSGIFTDDNKVVMAPLTYGWLAGDSTSNVFSASGTSSRVSAPFVSRVLNPDTPPNGPNNKYLIPALGINPLLVVSGLDLIWDFDIEELPFTQSKGIIFFWLATQEFYDFLTTSIGECDLPPYTVTPPSMLNAPLDTTISGNPPDPFVDFPGSNNEFNIVALEAIELTLDRGDWYYVGEDAGLETVSGMIARGHYQVGDQIRVRVRCWNSAFPDDPDFNWEGIWRVTLQPVDPFWDTIQQSYMSSYAAYIRVNTTSPLASLSRGAPSTDSAETTTAATTVPAADAAVPHSKPVLHMGPGAIMPLLLKGRRDGTGGRTRHRRQLMGHQMFSPIPEGANITTLPTLAEFYLQHRKRTVPHKLRHADRAAKRKPAKFPAPAIHKRRARK